MNIKSFFDFRGELDRRGFLIGYLLLTAGVCIFGLAVFAVGWVLGVAAIVAHADAKLVGKIAPVVMVAAVGLPALWAGIALYAKRARNIGANPALVVGAILVVGLADTFLKRKMVARLDVPMILNMTPICGAVMLTLLLFLFLWPARSDGGPVRSAPAIRHPGANIPSRAVFGRRGADI